MKYFFTDRRFRLPRCWSNRELREIGPLFSGDVVNVSAWEDCDKEGGHYKDYFSNARSHSYTNYGGYRGLQGMVNEYPLDLEGEVSENLRQRFDVVFNHTTLEHVFDVRKAFGNLCELSRDIVIVVVPFAQTQHESDDWKDYWRFSPTCLRRLYEENGLSIVYEAESPHRHSAIYLLSVGSRYPERWVDRFPGRTVARPAGVWIGANWIGRATRVVRSSIRGVCGSRPKKG